MKRRASSSGSRKKRKKQAPCRLPVCIFFHIAEWLEPHEFKLGLYQCAKAIYYYERNLSKIFTTEGYRRHWITEIPQRIDWKHSGSIRLELSTDMEEIKIVGWLSDHDKIDRVCAIRYRRDQSDMHFIPMPAFFPNLELMILDGVIPCINRHRQKKLKLILIDCMGDESLTSQVQRFLFNVSHLPNLKDLTAIGPYEYRASMPDDTVSIYFENEEYLHTWGR